MAHHGLVGHGQFAVAALLGRHIDDDAARLHALHHLGGDQPGRGFAGNEGSGDDDVGVLRLGGVHLALRGLEALAHHPGVAAAARAILVVIDLDEGATQGLDLVGHLSARVVGAHDGAQIGRCANRRQTSHTGTGHKHLGRGHLARSGDLAIEVAAKGVGRLNHSAVARDTGGGGQGIHLLRTRERARQAVHGQHRGLLGRQLLHQLGVLRGPDEADQDRARAHQRHFLGAGGAHLEHDVRSRPQRGGIGQYLGAHRTIAVIVEVGGRTGPGLHSNGKAQPVQLLHHIGHGGDALFQRKGLARNPDFHACLSLCMFCIANCFLVIGKSLHENFTNAGAPLPGMARK